MLSEISQTEKDKYCMISLICGIKKKKKKTHRHTDTHTHTHTHTHTNLTQR